jgi:hypothetical protein
LDPTTTSCGNPWPTGDWLSHIFNHSKMINSVYATDNGIGQDAVSNFLKLAPK